MCIHPPPIILTVEGPNELSEANLEARKASFELFTFPWLLDMSEKFQLWKLCFHFWPKKVNQLCIQQTTSSFDILISIETKTSLPRPVFTRCQFSFPLPSSENCDFVSASNLCYFAIWINWKAILGWKESLIEWNHDSICIRFASFTFFILISVTIFEHKSHFQADFVSNSLLPLKLSRFHCELKRQENKLMRFSDIFNSWKFSFKDSTCKESFMCFVTLFHSDFTFSPCWASLSWTTVNLWSILIFRLRISTFIPRQA